MDELIQWVGISDLKTRPKNPNKHSKEQIERLAEIIKYQGWRFDGFSGSGSTLIACEKTGRKCYGMEIDPIYCDVIIKRWENFTGKKAEKIGG